MYYMPLVSVRLSDDEKRRLRRHGKVSEVVREAVRSYLDSEDSADTFSRLRALQEKYRVKTTPEEMVRLIKEDRYRDSGR
jgi:Arc/MetJ-type ribon-helix-helix transcriptional regulator